MRVAKSQIKGNLMIPAHLSPIDQVSSLSGLNSTGQPVAAKKFGKLPGFVVKNGFLKDRGIPKLFLSFPFFPKRHIGIDKNQKTGVLVRYQTFHA
jgi:hypothetical protein